jgi:hypothetical protein
MGSGARVIRRDAPVSRQNKLLTGRTTIVIAPPVRAMAKQSGSLWGAPTALKHAAIQRNRSRLWIT